MLIIKGENVNQTYYDAIANLWAMGERQESRAGDVLVVPHPVMTVTTKPTQRVLFDTNRDANPFFHFFECLWMISGSRDARWLDTFVRDFSSRFAEPGGTQWGAYGHRWREMYGADQLDRVVHLLRMNHLDRRVVITMWDASADLFSPPEGVRDLPCNLQAIPRIVDGRLDLTVTNRSNDVVWGCYGANVVHFSFLQEYLAGRIGVPVGTLYQLSNNWHGYTDTLTKVGTPSGHDPYAHNTVVPEPIGSDWEYWDRDLALFMMNPGDVDQPFKNDWFREVACNMWQAHEHYRRCDHGMAEFKAACVEAEDWSMGTLEWLQRRKKV